MHVKKYNPCRTCLCIRCNCIQCKFEHFYNCYPVNAGCVHCMMTDNDKPVKECDGFRPRVSKTLYKIKLRRKNPYQNIAKLIASLHREIKKL